MTNTKKTPTPTRTNLYVLARTFAHADEVSSRVESVSINHLRRCHAAGLIEACGATMRITTAGRIAAAGHGAAANA